MKNTFKPTEIKELEQATYRLSIQDGIMEIFLGIMLITMSGLYTSSLPIGLVVVAMLFFFSYMSRTMKNKFTYPRTGYIKVRTENDIKREDIFSLIIFMGMIISLAGLLVLLLPQGYEDSGNLYRVTPFAFGLLLFGPAMHLAEKTGQDRYLLIGVLPTITGMAVTVLSVLEEPWAAFRGLQIFSLGWGVLFLVLGVGIFTNFVRSHPVLEEEPVAQE